MTRLDPGDYERVLAFLEEAYAEKGPAPFTPRLLDRLASVASSDAATFFEYTAGRDDVIRCVTCSGEDPEVLVYESRHPAWRTCTRTIELRRAKARGAGPLVLADVFPRRLRTDPEFNFNYRSSGAADEIHVDLDDASQWTVELAVFRSRDFGTRERLILKLLRPHLAALCRAATLRRRLEPAPDATASLTPRERQVVDLVEDGLSNAEIARVLVIESSTVRKHLEHVYEKLGVASRTAAVAKLRRR